MGTFAVIRIEACKIDLLSGRELQVAEGAAEGQSINKLRSALATFALLVFSLPCG